MEYRSVHPIMRAESREPRAESREPRAESREPRAESREPRAESREPRAESREPRAESREPRAESREPRAESREPRAESREPRAESREPRAESREPRAESREPRAESREPRAESREPRAESREPRAESREPRAESREPRAESREPRPLNYRRLSTFSGACPGYGGTLLTVLAALLVIMPAAAQAQGEPVFVSARTDSAGENIIVTFSEEVFVSPLVRYVSDLFNEPLSPFLRAVMTVTVDGFVDHINQVSMSGTELTLGLSLPPAMRAGQEVTVAYDNVFAVNAGGLFVDAAGNAVPYFSSTMVQNNSVLTGTVNLVAKPVVDQTALTINEGGSGTYTVALASPPSESVTIDIFSFPLAAVGLRPSSLTFTPDNWNQPQTVMVITRDDGNSIDSWAFIVNQIRGVRANRSAAFVRTVVQDRDTPLVVSGSTSTDYAENGTSPVATYSVADAAGAITWSLFGYDSSAFSISSAGGLTFNTPPDHEVPADSNGDNVYQVTIHASDGTSTGALLDVAINVTDVNDEPPAVASITSSATHPTKEGFTVTITFSDPVTGLTANEIEVTNGTGSNFAGAGAIYTLEITPNAGIEDDVTVTVTAGAVVDGLNNGNLQASAAFSVDTKAPTVSRIAITSNPGTDRTYAPGDVIKVTVTFDEAVVVAGPLRLTLHVGGGNRTANYQSGVDATLLFSYTVAGGESDTDGVGVEADSLSGGTIADEARNNAVLDHDGLAADAGHRVDGVKPQLAASGGAVVNGTRLTLTYDETLDGSSTPEMDDFTVAGGDRARTVSRVAVRGATVELTLDSGAEHEEAGIQVSYTPGMNPIRDVPGNEAEALSYVQVKNDTPDTTAPAVSRLAIGSNPGPDATYAIGEVIEATVTFDETVELEGTPRLTLRVGSRNRTAGYLRGSGAAALVFGYEVALGDEDTDGVSIAAGRIDRNGGTIKDEADNDAVLDHEAVAPQVGHKVDGVRPAFLSTAVDGSSLTLTYGEALDPGSRPAAGDFTVEVDRSGRSVSAVSVSGSVVTLTLDPAVEHGDTGIRVNYSPGTRPIRDAVGNDALGLSSQSVTNTTGAPNTAPEITSPSSFDVRENQSLVRRLVARDTDPGDEVTGWEIVGGVDQGQFTITSDTGELSFRTAPDFEAPGDNEYEVTVEVRSGAGARELEAERTFTVRVTDEREPPSIPDTPTFSGETAESMTVNWSEPENTGPPITDYDVQYREGGSGGFTDAQHEGPGFALTLSDLKAGTVYQVQVQATNEEGTGDWSEPGEGRTIAPLTVQMTTDLPPPVEGAFSLRFSFSEEVRGFTSGDIETQQEPACTDSANNPISCNPTIAALQTTDNRIFTTTVNPKTDRVAHNYTLTLTVPAGRVTSAAGNKPNEEATLEMRVAPPGVTVPISSIGLTANSGNSQVTLRWNTPQNTGDAPIVRYEYRWAESGGEFSAWVSVAPAERSATVRELTNGREYMFEVRGVNALGYGLVTTARAVARSGGGGPPSGGGPPGGGGPRQTVPDAPMNLLTDATDGAVTLTWEAPENDGGSAITDYEYRIDRRNPWISIGSTDTAHTLTGLVNGTAYVFEVRAVNRIGRGRASNRAEATPMAPLALDFAHFANGTGITSDFVLVNVSSHMTRPALYFYDQEGHLIDPESVVDVTGDLEVTEDGSLSVLREMEPLGQLTISTHGQGELVSGSVKVLSDGPIGGGVRYGVPQIGVAGVGASPPVRDVLFPARRQEGGIRTAAALHNLGEEAVGVNCRLMSGGVSLEEVEIPLEANGQTSWFIEEAFPTTDTSDFLGSVRCTVLGSRRFTAIAVEMDVARRIFNTLSVVPVERTGGGNKQTTLDFAHFVNGTWITDLVFVNLSTEASRPAPTPFHMDILPSRPAIYFYDTEGNSIAAESVVDITGDLEITEDGALTVQTEMEPLGVLTISTHGRGELVTGSVRVVSEGPIGGMLRFEHPDFGVAGVGASPPLSDALFPVRRQEGGITTGVALHNLEPSPGLLRCDLMREGVLRDSASIPLEANGQTSWLIDQAFPAVDTSDFAGSVRCDAVGQGLFSAVALEMDSGNRIFATLPVVPVPEMPSRE